jgi:hypothetical protein
MLAAQDETRCVPILGGGLVVSALRYTRASGARHADSAKVNSCSLCRCRNELRSDSNIQAKKKHQRITCRTEG